MARIRSIHPGIFTDEAYMALSFPSRELVKGIWCEADDQGIFEWKPLTLKARILPADNVDIMALLLELEDGDFVRPFDADGKRFGAIKNFGKWQRPKEPKYTHPMPDDLRDYVKWKPIKASKRESLDTSSGETSPPLPQETVTTSPKSAQREEGGGRRKKD